MKIYIDISSLVNVNFITGIQRVVREIVIRMLKSKKYIIVLLNYNHNKQSYEIINNDKFLRYFRDGLGVVGEIKTTKTCEINDIEYGSVFFDIDSVWTSRLKRSYLLSILKSNGVKIAVQIYDIIPITHPQYCHQNTTYWFMNYLGAHLKYADLIILSTNSTLDEINKLTDRLNINRVNAVVVPLGSDFKKISTSDQNVEDRIIDIVNKGKYVLMVGTIEPRKNHKMLLDAFDIYLKDYDINIVIAGRIGWNVDELEKRIISHKYYGKRIFFVDKSNDVSIDFLYKNAFLMAFPTYNEGFGLPIIESIERGTPVIASNIEVLKEVGGGCCKYFNPDDPKELADLIIENLINEDQYKEFKNRTKEFVPFTWDNSSELMMSYISSIENKSPLIIPEIKQMVILSARDEDLLNTLPFIENMMTFIKEIVICCPDNMVNAVKDMYNGKLKLVFLTDTEILEGRQLPEDHACRNFFLRCLMLQSNLLDDVFIMSDDDYRPLVPISEEVFVKNGKYQAYYCFHINRWKGAPNNITSYDISMMKTSKFLEKNNYPTLQFSSHMPQVIDKRIYNELLAKHNGIENKGYDEWSVYFNYGAAFYQEMFENQKYVTMCWPALATDWNMEVIPKQFLFENYYTGLYQKESIFEGFSQIYNENILQENINKVNLYLRNLHSHEITQQTYLTFKEIYNYNYKQYPSISILYSNGLQLEVPKYLVLNKNGCTKINIECKFIDCDESIFPLKLEYNFATEIDEILLYQEIKITKDLTDFVLPFFSLKYRGIYKINFSCKDVNNIDCIKKRIPVLLID